MATLIPVQETVGLAVKEEDGATTFFLLKQPNDDLSLAVVTLTVDNTGQDADGEFISIDGKQISLPTLVELLRQGQIPYEAVDWRKARQLGLD